MATKAKKIETEGKGRAATYDNLSKRGNVWYAQIVIGGKRVRKSCGRDKKGAQEMLGKLRAQAERDALGLAKRVRETPTLAEFQDKYLSWAKAHKRSWPRDVQSLGFLVPVFGLTRLPKITKKEIEVYQRNRLAEGVKGATVNREVACIRKILSVAVDMGAIEANPLLRVRMLPESAGRIPVLEPVDEARLLQHGPHWFRLMVRLATATGCREGELLALRWRHLDIDGGYLTVADSKSGDSRRVPLHPAVLPFLRAEREGQGADGFVFLSRAGTPPSRYSVTHELKDAATKIGRPELRFHDLRHVAGTRLLATGASLPEVATMLGHKTLAMSKRYAHVSPVRLSGLVAAMAVADSVVVPLPPVRRRRAA